MIRRDRQSRKIWVYSLIIMLMILLNFISIAYGFVKSNFPHEGTKTQRNAD